MISKVFFKIVFFLIFISLSLSAQELFLVNEKFHIKECSTQGLIIKDNIVWESCGGYDKSQVIKWNISTGKILKKIKLPNEYFAEGLTELNDHLFVLTWKAGILIKMNLDSLGLIEKYNFKGDGWGLTTNGTHLIISDGSDILKFVNPDTFNVENTIKVQFEQKSIKRLNELEWVNGEIWANVYKTNYIIVINPNTGDVVERYNISNLYKAIVSEKGVMNGIAFDKTNKKLWLTGKHWQKIFEVNNKKN